MATLPLHIDCLDLSGDHIIVGLSALEGNIWDGGIALLTVENGSLESYATTPTGIPSIAFLGDNQNLIGAGSDDGYLRLYNRENLIFREAAYLHGDIISSISVLPRKTTQFLTTSWDEDMKLWDLENLADPILWFKNAHSGPIHDCQASYHEPTQIASVGMDGLLRLWDLRQPKPTDCLTLYAHNLSLSCVEWDQHHPERLLVGTEGGEMLVVDLRQTDQTLHLSTSYSIGQHRVRRILSHPTYRDIVTSCSDDGSLWIGKVEEDKNAKTVHVENLHHLEIHEDQISDLGILPTAMKQGGERELTVCTCSFDKTVRISELTV